MVNEWSLVLHLIPFLLVKGFVGKPYFQIVGRTCVNSTSQDSLGNDSIPLPPPKNGVAYLCLRETPSASLTGGGSVLGA